METKHRIRGGADSVARDESEHHRAGRNACAGNDDGLALITPLLIVSSMAQQYVGGPKSGIAPTTRQVSSGGDIYAQGGDVYAQGVRGPLVPAGMMGDRADVIFAAPEEISKTIEARC